MEIYIPPQQIYANSKGAYINEGGVMSSECGKGKIVLCMYRCSSSQRWVRIMSMKQHQTALTGSVSIFGCGLT